jgi:hypothetical protein
MFMKTNGLFAGISRQEAEDERSSRGRSREPLGPEFCVACRDAWVVGETWGLCAELDASKKKNSFFDDRSHLMYENKQNADKMSSLLSDIYGERTSIFQEIWGSWARFGAKNENEYLFLGQSAKGEMEVRSFSPR